jgi:RNA polymerase sigma factor (sigma-70 family)
LAMERSLTGVEAQETDPATFDAFYQSEHAALFRSILLLTGERAEAEDVAHEAFVRVLERWDRVARMEAPRAYLFKIALNLHRNAFRRNWRKVRRATIESGVAEDFSQGAVDRAEVVRILQGLSPEQREAVVLVDLVGMSSAEAGHALSVNADAVRATVHRARTAMRQEMTDDG